MLQFGKVRSRSSRIKKCTSELFSRRHNKLDIAMLHRPYDIRAADSDEPHIRNQFAATA